MTRERLGAVLVALLGTACAAPPSVERTSREQSQVVEGEASESGIEDAVLLLRTEVDGRELVCSASLVAPNLALTARHCVSHVVEGLFSCTVRGELVDEGSGAGRLGSHLPVGDIEFFGGPAPRDEPLARGQEILSTLSETVCQNDIAFVVLDRPLELPVLPLRLAGRARLGELAILVGYGLDETQSETEPFDVATQRRTRKADLPIRDVGPDSNDDVVTTAPPRSIVLEGPSGCVGDSGGPLVAQETKAVLGVYSLLGAETCLARDARHLFTHVPPFQALIDDAFLAAGREPIPEPTDDPGEGSAGAGGAGSDGSAGAAGADPGGAGGSGGTAGDEPDGSAGAAGAGSEPEVRRPRRAPSGCAFSVAPDASAKWIAFGIALLGAACAMRRRAQRRPSRGSSGRAAGGVGCAVTVGRGRGAAGRAFVAADAEGTGVSAVEADATATALDGSPWGAMTTAGSARSVS